MYELASSLLDRRQEKNGYQCNNIFVALQFVVCVQKCWIISD